MEQTVPVQLSDGSRLFVRAGCLDSAASNDDEQEIAGRIPSLTQVTDAVTGFSRQIGESLRQAAPSHLTVEFECEFAIEAGGLVAVIGKGSGKTAFRVTMEWSPASSSNPE